MSTPYDSLDKIWALTPAEVLRLFQNVGHLIGRGLQPKPLLEEAAQNIGSALPIDRCTFLLCTRDSEDLQSNYNLEVAADCHGTELETVAGRTYTIASGSELSRLLEQGRPVPLKDIMSPDGTGAAEAELERFITDTTTKSVVAFPMTAGEKLIGALCLHQCRSSQPLPEHILELGETLAEELGVAVERCCAIQEHEAEGQVFRNTSAPALILDRGSHRIRRVNNAAYKVLAGTRKDLHGLPLLQVIPDGQRIINGARELSRQQPSATISGVLVGSAEGKPVHMDALLTLLNQDARDDMLLLLMPPSRIQTGGDLSESGRAQRAEELANNLTRQLSWERWVRQVICKLHATLDRDTLLQTLVDGFGRALGASRCLIVRTDGPASPMVTHEYAEADTSPLGLGRTGQFPSSAVSFFKHKVGAVPDLTTLERTGELSPEEYEYFVDNGIRSMAGAPISSHGVNYGVIIILESGAGRKWAPHELDMLEIAANQTAVALGHSQAYLQLKDQLFNMNLLGNLTQQLTNTLELVSRTGKVEGPEEKARPAGNSPPLSLRELEVLKLIAGGLANREIAQRLFLTESTVELHASRIRKKLKLKSRTALVKYACDNGLA